MFYIIQFYKILKTKALLGGFFVTLTILLVLVSGGRNYFENNISKIIPEDNSGSFFFALIDGKENINQLTRKLKNLPGIYTVKIFNKNEVKEKAKTLLKGLEMDDISADMELDYHGLRINYTNKVSPRGQELIREYLNRLVGEKKVFLGPIQNKPQDLTNAAKVMGFVRENSWTVLFSITSFFWLISFFAYKKTPLKTSYLLEQFQRKKNIGPKIMVSGTLTIVIPIVLFLLLIDYNSWPFILFTVLFLICLNIIFLRKGQWEY